MSNKYDDIIPLVRKPSRYLGREINSVQKDPARVKIRFALVFPDMYEIGMSNLGLKILYHLLNQKEEIWAERAFLPAPDFESLMRSRGISLSSLESRTSLREFDIVGISIPHELNLSGILNVLDLSGIPLRAEDRQEGFPLILGGGGGGFNPEPVAPFFDAILIGDGEEAVLKIVDRFQRHRGARRGKGELLQSLAEVEGVYVPSFHPRTAGSLMVKRTIAKDLDRLPFPSSPIVPFLDIVHNRIVVEIARGCTVGCRFCQAGMVYRPVRERSVENICRLVRENLDATGYEEATFLSLSASDYSQLSPLLSALNRELQNRTLAFSLPSLRVRPLKPEILAELSRVKRGGITLAPEAGTERLRRSLNKPASDEEIVESVARVFQAGWPAVKLYFMVGLPGEGPEDLEGIASLVRLIKREAAPRGSGKTIRVSVGGFIPKAHTPFQWERMASLRELEEARGLLREALPRGGVEFKFHNPRFSLLEGILARGDRSLADVIQGAFARGARFDSWKEYFRWEIWEEAFRETGLDFEQHLGPFDIDSPLPWNHIDCGPSREFLEQERERSRAGETTDPCGRSGCSECGLCGAGRSSNEEVSPRLAPAPRGSPVSGEVWGRSARGSGNERKVWISRYRVRFEKTGPARFLCLSGWSGDPGFRFATPRDSIPFPRSRLARRSRWEWKENRFSRTWS